MKSTNPYSLHPKHLQNIKAQPCAKTSEAVETPTPPPTASTIRTTPQDFVNPVDYEHPYDSMARYAKALARRYDANRTRHRYPRDRRRTTIHIRSKDVSLLVAPRRHMIPIARHPKVNGLVMRPDLLA